MKKLSLFLIKNLCAVLACMAFSCGEKLEEVPVNTISQISTFEKESVRLHFTYANSRISGFDKIIDDIAYRTNVYYDRPGQIHCEINGIEYEIQFANTRGGYRAETVTASRNHGSLYSVEYEYDKQGRIAQARIDGVGNIPYYVKIKYEANSIEVNDASTIHRIELSSVDNAGKVCNVLDYAGGHYTSNYVINPDLYFLNIYGVSIDKLPLLPQEEIEYDSNQRLTRVGNCYFTY